VCRPGGPAKTACPSNRVGNVRFRKNKFVDCSVGPTTDKYRVQTNDVRHPVKRGLSPPRLPIRLRRLSVRVQVYTNYKYHDGLSVVSAPSTDSTTRQQQLFLRGSITPDLPVSGQKGTPGLRPRPPALTPIGCEVHLCQQTLREEPLLLQEQEVAKRLEPASHSMSVRNTLRNTAWCAPLSTRMGLIRRSRGHSPRAARPGERKSQAAEDLAVSFTIVGAPPNCCHK
jgi:hypothetical protein